MDPVDSIKRRLDDLLPGNHRLLLLGLLGFLIIITHDNDYTGYSLESRQTISPGSITAEIHPPVVTTTINDIAKTEIQNLQRKPQITELPGTAYEPRQTASNNIEAQPEPAPLTDLVAAAGTIPDFSTEVKAGDNLTLIFKRAGLNARDVYEVSNSQPMSTILNNLYPGYQLDFTFQQTPDSGKKLGSLTIIKNKLESVEFNKIEEGYYVATEHARKPDIKQVFREATIDDSLFLAAQRGGMSAGVTMELAGIFGGVIDFLLDTRKGDTFNLLYEEKFVDDEYIGYGRILAAQFTNQGETYTAVRYVNQSGDSDFYNPDGESMRKAFLRNPVDFTRISSGFSLSRKHPILSTIRAHKGTDYAAPRGTPVVAAGDGRVTWASRNGSFGKLVIVQHGEKFQTKYAHLNDYAKGIKNGARVKQGQVIGYVGSTGGATGPHLHYEFLMDGVHRNSRTIHDKLPKAESVAKSEMQRFREQTQIILAQLETHVSSTKNIAQHSVLPEK